MKIGIPKEIKDHECRVGATPTMVHGFTEARHEVLIQSNAGAKIGFTDEMYQRAGAKIVATAKEAWSAELVLKVKEPQNEEFPYMHEGQILLENHSVFPNCNKFIHSLLH